MSKSHSQKNCAPNMRYPEKSIVQRKVYQKILFHVSKMQTNIARVKNEHAIDYIQNSSSDNWNQASQK